MAAQLSLVRQEATGDEIQAPARRKALRGLGNETLRDHPRLNLPSVKRRIRHDHVRTDVALAQGSERIAAERRDGGEPVALGILARQASAGPAPIHPATSPSAGSP